MQHLMPIMMWKCVPDIVHIGPSTTSCGSCFISILRSPGSDMPTIFFSFSRENIFPFFCFLAKFFFICLFSRENIFPFFSFSRENIFSTFVFPRKYFSIFLFSREIFFQLSFYRENISRENIFPTFVFPRNYFSIFRFPEIISRSREIISRSTR